MRPFIITEYHKNYLSDQDPVLGQLIAKVPPIKRDCDDHYFRALLSNIIYQQISISAGNAIWGRFLDLAKHITPNAILSHSTEQLRACGLSQSKTNYVHAIAKAFESGFVTDEFLKTASPENITERLITIKGIGTWTAEMFLMFSLGHENIFSYKDLGLRKGIQWLYDLDEPPTEAFVNTLLPLWTPYTTIAAFYLWEITIQRFRTEDRKQILGQLPYRVKDQGLGYLESPIGLIEIRGTLKGISHITFVNTIKTTEINETPLIRLAKTELRAYFKGELKTFNLPLDYLSTAFQKHVYDALIAIPYGNTSSYSELAHFIGNAKASRAVGNANHNNPISIVIPCHRIIGAKGQLVGYAGGLDKKEWLLEHEIHYNK